MKLEKISVVFFIITIILLISLTAISMFFFQKEIERRKGVEAMLTKSKASEDQLNRDLEAMKKKAYLFEEKNKELDDKLNNASEELDVEKGLREQMKKDSMAVTEELEKVKQAKVKAEKDFDELGKELFDAKTMLKEREAKITELQDKLAQKEKDFSDLKKENEGLKAGASGLSQADAGENSPQAKITVEMKPDEQSVLKAEKNANLGIKPSPLFPNAIEIAPIVASADGNNQGVPAADKNIPTGRILSVDTDTDFVIINLGQKDGVKNGIVMGVYRGREYLGDIKISRVQMEMSAADVLPPLVSKAIRKNDQVAIRE